MTHVFKHVPTLTVSFMDKKERINLIGVIKHHHLFVMEILCMLHLKSNLHNIKTIGQMLTTIFQKTYEQLDGLEGLVVSLTPAWLFPSQPKLASPV